jgi:cyclopropane-fatty-acyl-phospholipid synthase
MSSPVSSHARNRSSSTQAAKPQTAQAGLGTSAEAPGVPRFDVLTHPPTGSRKSTAVERWLARRMHHAMGSPPVRVVLFDGQEVPCSGPRPIARVLIHNRATLWKLVSCPNLNFGEGYSEGSIEVEGDLVEFLEAIHRAKIQSRRPAGAIRSKLCRLKRRMQPNSLRGSRKNIHQHYDIGNDFYRLWLDKQLLYTCAYFPTPEATLEEAQVAKMDHVCRKLWLRPGETVVEAGCGWGALALHMARHYGVRVKALNISHEQIAYARQRARQEGLDSQVEFIEDDYRTIAGRFDAFVSVGMLEHVGADHYGDLGRVIHRCLRPDGRGLIHSIGQNRPGELSAWLRKRIFPGAYPPSLCEMASLLEPWGFAVLDVENLRLHYAETLRHWLRRFESAAGAVAEMFDQRFVRAWRLYLAGSVAAFATGSLQLFQVLFARPGVNEIPWTRARLYEGPNGPGSH